VKRKRVSDAYRKVRKPVPPPARVIRDRRRKVREKEARREIEEREP
jgi:hypothetical protein